MSPGIRILSTHPAIGQATTAFLGESTSFRVAVVVPVDRSSEDFSAEMITNVKDSDNATGEWIRRQMKLERNDILTSGSSSSRRLIFVCVMLPTHEGNFEATARVVCRTTGEEFHASTFRQNAYLNVYRSIHHVWATGPKLIEILPNLYLGNLIAACNATNFGIDCILNTTEECDVFIPDNSAQAIAYKKVPIEDGVAKPIPKKFVEECVRWVLSHPNKRVLVHCRASKFRSASIMVAIVYKLLSAQGGFSYDDAVRFVQRKKPDTAMHSGLRETLLELWPQKSTPQITVPANSPLQYVSRAAPAPHNSPLGAVQPERQR